MNSGGKMSLRRLIWLSVAALFLLVSPAFSQEDVAIPVQGSVLSKTPSEASLPNPALVAGVAREASVGLSGGAAASQEKGGIQPTAQEIAQAAAAVAAGGAADSLESARPNAIELLAKLKAAGASKPLTLAELAAVNDAMKRMEYLSELDGKVSDLKMAGGASLGAVVAMPSKPVLPVSGAPGLQAAGETGEYQVLQVTGSQGVYKALVSAAGQTMYVRAGDSLPIGTVASVALSGVKISSPTGLIALPFKSQSAGLLRTP